GTSARFGSGSSTSGSGGTGLWRPEIPPGVLWKNFSYVARFGALIQMSVYFLPHCNCHTLFSRQIGLSKSMRKPRPEPRLLLSISIVSVVSRGSAVVAAFSAAFTEELDVTDGDAFVESFGHVVDGEGGDGGGGHGFHFDAG